MHHVGVFVDKAWSINMRAGSPDLLSTTPQDTHTGMSGCQYFSRTSRGLTLISGSTKKRSATLTRDLIEISVFGMRTMAGILLRLSPVSRLVSTCHMMMPHVCVAPRQSRVDSQSQRARYGTVRVVHYTADCTPCWGGCSLAFASCVRPPHPGSAWPTFTLLLALARWVWCSDAQQAGGL